MAMTMQEKLIKTQRSNAWKNNAKHVEALGFQLPDDLLKKIKEQTKMVSKIQVCSYNQFCDLFSAVTMPDFSAVAVSSVNANGSLPVMYVYFPGAEQKLAEVQKVKRQKFSNMKQKSSMFKMLYGREASEKLKNFIYSLPANIPYKTRFCGSREHMAKLAGYEDSIIYGSDKDDVFAIEHNMKNTPTITIFVSDLTEELIAESKERHFRQKMVSSITDKLLEDYKIEASNELKNFITSLPSDIPNKFNFDGSRGRVANLSMKEGATIHGSMSDDVFAVVHNLKGTPMITFFVKEIDYVAEFANKLVKRLRIDEETAKFISNSLDHDRYYGGLERFNDYEGYFNEVSERLRLKPGKVVHDICQGDVVFSKTKENTATMNPKLPSAVLAEYNLLVYYPA